MTLFGRRVPMFLSLLVWLVVWEIVGRLDLVFLLPPITSIVEAGIALVQTTSWQTATLETAQSFLFGMLIAIGAGVPIGILMGRVKPADYVLGLWVNMLSSAPLSAMVPVLMVMFGIGGGTVIATVVLFSIWIIILDTRAGVLGLPTSIEEMARSYGASRIDLYRKVILGAAVPEILTGIRLGTIRGLKGVIVGQILVAIVGYGALFETFSRNFEMDRFWALAFILFTAAMLLSAAIEALEHRVEYYARFR